ncbi:MAG: hypothetical protein JW908_00210 [Anaerolineales bacterium]|nr:hypothetical protein [Anaerolineales bacterium]
MPHTTYWACFDRLFIKIVSSILGVFLLSGCATLSDPEATQIYHTDMVGSIDETHTLEQTIHTRQTNIDSIFLWLQSTPDSPTPAGKITFELYNPPQAESPYAAASIKAGTFRPDQPILITFQPKNKASSHDYKLVIQAKDCTIQVFGRAEDNYAPGTAIQDSTVLPGDIAFRIKYLYDLQTLWHDFSSLLPQSWLVVIFFLFCFIPGSFLLSILKINPFFNSAERIGLTVAVSLALPVLLMEWSSLLDFRWSKTGVWCIYLTFAVMYSLRGIIYTKRYIEQKQFFQNPSQILTAGLINWLHQNRYLLALFLIFIFSLAIRLIMIRDLAAPPWVDSVHHALLTRIIMEQGQFPQTYSPYISADNARYHPGYHVMLAVFQWLSGLEMQTGMLLFGQILNASIVLSVFLFACTLTKNQKTGLFAALIAGVFTPMPAYYTSWGRYTQLAGLILLPAAFALIHFILSSKFSLLQNKRQRLRILFMASIICASLFITHYRVIIFLALLLIALCLINCLSPTRHRYYQKPFSHDLLLILSIVVISIALSFPWLPGALAEFIVPRIESSLKGDTAFAGHSWSYLTAGLGTWTLYLAMAGIILGIFTRKKFTWILVIWVISLFLMANMNMLKLPMSGFINNTSVEIALFLPIAVLGAYGFVLLIEIIGKRLRGNWAFVFNGVLWIGIIALTFYGAYKIIPILNPDTVLARQSDIPAIQWIEKNIPAEETIAINPFAWGYGLYTGADGGFWITPLSGRKTMPPPLLYGFDTEGEISQYVTQLSKNIIIKGSYPAALYELLISENIHYVYLGAKGGVFSHQKLIESGLYNLIYSENGSWIFALVR